MGQILVSIQLAVWIFKTSGVVLELGSQLMLLPPLIVLWQGGMSQAEGRLMGTNLAVIER